LSTSSVVELLDKKRILITGASGLVGISLLRSLSNLSIKRSQVISITAITRTDALGKLNFPGISLNFIDINLLDKNEVQKLGRFDFIVHAAGSADPQYFKKFQRETFLLNSITTDFLLDLLADGGRFIFLSSTELYSGTSDVICNEQSLGITSPFHPRAGYIEGKRAGEMFVNWRRDQGKNATSIRLSYTYGPTIKTKDSRVINEFIESSLKLKKITMKDSGEAKRPNLFSGNAAEMILNVLFNSKRPLYNIANNKISSILEIARIIAEITNSELHVPESNSSYDTSAQNHINVDISSYISDFGLPVFTSLEDGLRETIVFRRNFLKA
jgi:nucleoside-diphosphate-sugar epimerase